MRIGIFTSVETRHRYFVQRLRERFDVVAVVHEETGYSPACADASELTPNERAIVERHYADRAEQERRFFGAQAVRLRDGLDAAVRDVAKAELNTPATVEFLRGAGAEVVLVYGTDLIRPPLLDAFAGRMVNMHLGLSPYYRGTATNFYPLLNEEPEYVGATIHLLNAGIDSGPILIHGRPDIVAEDRPHAIGCKAIRVGVDAMLRILPEWHAGRRRAVGQWPVPNARLYLRKDFHPRHVVELHHKIEAGLIRRYVERAHEVAPHVRVVS